MKPRTHRSAAASALLERAAARATAPTSTNHVAFARRIASALDGLEGVAANRSPTETEEAHALRVAKNARALSSEIAETKARMHSHLSDVAQALGQKINQRTGLSGQSPHGEEIRAVFRGMNSPQRLEAIGKAMDERDTDLLNAVLLAPAILTGLDPKYVSDMRSTFERMVAPDLTAELDTLLEVDVEAYEFLRVADLAAKEAVRPEYIRRIMEDAARADAAQADFAATLAPPMAAE